MAQAGARRIHALLDGHLAPRISSFEPETEREMNAGIAYTRPVIESMPSVAPEGERVDAGSGRSGSDGRCGRCVSVSRDAWRAGVGRVWHASGEARGKEGGRDGWRATDRWRWDARGRGNIWGSMTSGNGQMSSGCAETADAKQGSKREARRAQRGGAQGKPHSSFGLLGREPDKMRGGSAQSDAPRRRCRTLTRRRTRRSETCRRRDGGAG